MDDSYSTQAQWPYHDGKQVIAIMRIRTRLVPLAAAASLIGTALVIAAPAGAAQALSCYGSANSYFKPDGPMDYPAGDLLWSSGACNDINIKPKTNRYVMVCVEDVPGGTMDCPQEYVRAAANQWTVVKPNVDPGTAFVFKFRSAAQSSGSWAA
ncbi:hypothetical protein [Embleya scabrispora]|uniref:hypothetical protein n=1 Tax=Embleya scabrispora TaxID=159449 RepID=UPI0003A8368A|nr:hypothetical protein [Embleya scabrispora]MYS84048.1 hypothetical protein [Streptomyces sp. SID5474]